MTDSNHETPTGSPSDAIEALASYVLITERARFRDAMISVIDQMAEAQRLPANAGDLQRAMIGSFAICDAERARCALLQRMVGPDLPLCLLDGSPWKFGTEIDKLPPDELVKAVQIFCEDFYGDDESDGDLFQPEAIVLKSPYLILLGCSHPPEKPPRFFLRQFTPDDGTAFRAGELMVKVIAGTADELRDSGRRFFQGLDLKERVGDPVLWLPLYQMRFSSDYVPPGVDPEIGWQRLRHWKQGHGAEARSFW